MITNKCTVLQPDIACQDEVNLPLANVDLASYEINEETFITEMLTSWAFEQISSMSITGDHVYPKRESPAPIKVEVVINEKTNTWCWLSDYLKQEDYSDCYSLTKTIPVGKSYEEAVKYISCTSQCEYRFRGNDEYNKKES